MSAEPEGFPSSTVSVIIPCFNHGVFLMECVASVLAQTRSADEVIVIDDGSSDEYTIETLVNLETAGKVAVHRQDNQGPSAARNLGVRVSTGSYVLPLDADNKLMPNAIEVLLAQIQLASPRVGWIYLNQQFFGCRDDYSVQPVFNAYRLLRGPNFCDTCALISRQVFDAGVMYREGIGLGHEDWDFYVRAFERGFLGEACPHRLLYTRKHGFTRSDCVDHRVGSFEREIKKLNPDFYAPENLLSLKRSWAPALSVILPGGGLPSIVAADRLTGLLEGQTCQDFEVVAEEPVPSRGDLTLGSVRPLLQRAKGKYLLLWVSGGTEAMADRAFLEKGLRLLEHNQGIDAVLLPAATSSSAHAWAPVIPLETQPTSMKVLGIFIRADALHRAQKDFAAPDRDEPISCILSLLMARSRDCLVWRSLPSHGEVAYIHALPAKVARRPNMDTNGGRLATDLRTVSQEAIEQERFFRVVEALPIWRGHTPIDRPPVHRLEHEGEDSWEPGRSREQWHPEHTRRLLLTVDNVTRECRLFLERELPWHPEHKVHSIAGRVYTQHFPGTSPIFRVADRTSGRTLYCFSSDCRHDPSHDVVCLGYGSSSYLPGMVHLLNLAAPSVRAGTLLGAMLETHCPASGAFLEPDCLTPLEVDGDATPEQLLSESWPLYELERKCPRDYRYTFHPDEALIDASGEWTASAVVGCVLALPSRRRHHLYVLEQKRTGRLLYGSDHEEGSALGYLPIRTLGQLSSYPAEDTIPLYRFHGPADRSHRLSLRPHLDDSRYELDGSVGFAAASPRGRGLLRRWRRKSAPAWRYTFDCGAALAPGPDWELNATLGFAHMPDATARSTLSFVELQHPVSGAFAYSVHPVEFEGFGYCQVRVVARLPATHETGAVPLRRAYSPVLNTHVYGLSADEHELRGFRDEGVFAYVYPAVPPMRVLYGEPDILESALEDVAHARESRLGSVPIYHFDTPNGNGFIGTDHVSASASGWSLNRVVGYLDVRSPTSALASMPTARRRPIIECLGKLARSAQQPWMQLRILSKYHPVRRRSIQSPAPGTPSTIDTSGDPRDQFIAQTVPGRAFLDVGGLWGTINEKVSVALRTGAVSATMLDITPEGEALWEAFHVRCSELGVKGYSSISASLDDPQLVHAIGAFDVVHCSGVLYHCPNPMLSLGHLRQLTTEFLILTSAVIPEGTDVSVAGNDRCEDVVFVPYLSEEQRVRFSTLFESRGCYGAIGITEPNPHWDANDYAPWWWLFRPQGVRRMLLAAGFDILEEAPIWEGIGQTYFARARR